MIKGLLFLALLFFLIKGGVGVLFDLFFGGKKK